MARVLDDGSEAFQKPKPMAQPFLLEPVDGSAEDDNPVCADGEYYYVETHPPIIHIESCPTTFPLMCVTGKGWERYECWDCGWEWQA